MTFKFSARSLRNLEGVHPDLRRVMQATLDVSTVDFAIIEGIRTVERQAKLFAAGKSQTMKSRHIHGFAVDFAAFKDGVISWEDAFYKEIADAVKISATRLAIPVVCGIDWAFRDPDHIELDRTAYPDPEDAPLIA